MYFYYRNYLKHVKSFFTGILKLKHIKTQDVNVILAFEVYCFNYTVMEYVCKANTLMF